MTANGGPYFGETIGRYGNRIANGTFQLYQPPLDKTVTCTVPINNGVNSLHGGIVGFGDHIWSATTVHAAGAAGVQLKLVSPNGDQGGAIAGCSGFPGGKCTGYPGTLTTYVTFLITSNNQMVIHYHATVAGFNTVLNLTNHNYFDLAGESSGATYNQLVRINADKYSPTDATQIPLGVNVSVKGTPLDFRTFHPIGSRITENNEQLLIAQGYGHNWVLNQAKRAHPRRPGLRPDKRAPAHGRDRPACCPVLHGQLPHRHPRRHQRPHLQAELGLHVRDPALAELAEPAELPLHGTEAGRGVRLDNHSWVQHR